MRFVLAAASLLAVLATATACDNATGCDFREGSVNGPEDRCQERSGISAPMFTGACEVAQGEVVEGGCPDDGKVLACDLGMQADLTSVIDWYYEPMTREDAEGDCDGTIVE